MVHLSQFVQSLFWYINKGLIWCFFYAANRKNYSVFLWKWAAFFFIFTSLFDNSFSPSSHCNIMTARLFNFIYIQPHIFVRSECITDCASSLPRHNINMEVVLLLLLLYSCCVPCNKIVCTAFHTFLSSRFLTSRNGYKGFSPKQMKKCIFVFPRTFQIHGLGL